jgi:hypothetical protein
MALGQCRLALRQLRGFVSGRDDQAARPGTPFPAPGQSPSETLLRLADAFAHELEEAGYGGELTRRADGFLALTGPGSDLDRAATRLCQALSAFEPLPEAGPPRSRDWREDTDAKWNSLRRLENLAGSLDRLRWNIPCAIEDSRPSQKLKKLTSGVRDALESFHAALRGVRVESERGHLFGCFILKTFRDLRTAGRDAQGQDRQFFAEVRVRYSRDLLDAAQHLVAAAEEADPGPATGSGGAGDATSGPSPESEPEEAAAGTWVPDWGHAAPPPAGSKFKYGPLTGDNQKVARIVGRVFGVGTDRRALCSLDECGEVWVHRPRKRLSHVWFKLEDHWKKGDEMMTR